MSRPQQVRDVTECLPGKSNQNLWLHLQEPPPSDLDSADTLGGEQAPRRVGMTMIDRQQLGKDELADLV